MNSVRTDLLEIAFEERAIEQPSRPPATWMAGCAARLECRRCATSYGGLSDDRAVSAWLGPDSVSFPETPRVGAGAALAQDALDLADQLGLERFAVVGHDWGARVAYALAILAPERVTSVTALALAYQPRGLFKIPAFDQAKRFWYQWFLCVDGGAAKVLADPVGFSRIQWDTWSPAGWFDEAEFAETAECFKNPDWAAITLNAYRARWREDEVWDARYDSLQRKLRETETICRPTVMIQGGSDFCDAPSESEGLESYFTADYQRILLDGVRHFPHREAHQDVADAVLRHLCP
jgi:pimeloyl-ACP methyl ester carboxylesterase